LKNLVEKADWHEPYIHKAHKLYQDGDIEGALIHYFFSAELGYETAQTNAAWILDKNRISNVSLSSIFKGDPGLKISAVSERHALAFPLWNRASNQGNVDARVKLGDYYFYSYLTPENRTAHSRLSKAAAYYRVAAENERSALAMWNIAWMYEKGLGLERDFHLAKRMYDLCLSTNSGGYLPVKLALWKLYLKWIWLWITRQTGDMVDPFSDVEAISKTKKGSRAAHTSSGDELPVDEMEMFEGEEGGITENTLILGLLALGLVLGYWRYQLTFHDQRPPPIPSNSDNGEQEPLLEAEELEDIDALLNSVGSTTDLLRQRNNVVPQQTQAQKKNESSASAEDTF
jgi:SEL1 protein